MPKGRAKSAPAPVVTEETIAADFGRHLYSLHASSDPPSIFDLQLRYYGDYLHHFGFSVETERLAPAVTYPRDTSFCAAAHSPVGTATAAASPTGTAAGPGAGAGSGAEKDPNDDIARAADFGIAAAERDEADRWAEAIGPLDGETDAAVIAARLAEPFARATWRQSAAQCAMKKTRAVYRWICANITIEPREAAPLGEVTNTAPVADTRRTPQRQRPSTRASANTSSKTNTNPNTSTNANAAPAAADVVTAALKRRVSNAAGVAALYSELLRHVGVTAVVVDGHVRGRGPEEMIEWAWNEVHVPRDGGGGTEARLLVDVALSAYRGPLRSCQRPSEDTNTNINTNANANAAANAQATANAPTGGNVSAKGRRAGALGTAAEVRPRRGLFDGPLLAPMHSAAPGAVEDFYFATHPSQFAGTHFPRDTRHTLLLSHPRRVAWEQAPCLSHTFFRFPVALVSHRRRCGFTVRSTPFHVTLSNALPDRVELCAVLFRGSLSELPEDVAAATPLGPEWVWHQREEATACETFTLMVPAAGYYSLVVGARDIRKDPFSSIAAGEWEPFVPIVAYQVLVTFVPVQVPQLPRQHKSPSICKLIAPLTYQVAEGSTRFIVMPSCANVTAVAIVARRTVDGTRELLTFLPFSMEKVAYDGVAELCAGCEAEIWIRYAAPDHNYMNSTELPLVRPSSLITRRQNSTNNRHSSMAMTAATTSAAGGIATVDAAAQEAAAMFFVPFVTHIEVRKAAVVGKGAPHIAPQPSLECEQLPTLRRLIGVTPGLHEEAKAVAERNPTQVGSYFAKKKSTHERINDS